MPGQPRLKAKRIRKLLSELEEWGNRFHERIPSNYRQDGPSSGTACSLWRGAADALSDHYQSLADLSQFLDEKAGYQPAEEAVSPKEPAQEFHADTIYELYDQSATIAEWCERLEIPVEVVLQRIADGEHPELAITLPVDEPDCEDG